jgi:hypothetical protein
MKKSKESTRHYFVQLFEAKPELLNEATNDMAVEQWEKDHPGRKCTASIKSSISNVKTFVRKKLGMRKLRRRRGKRGRMARATNGVVTQAVTRKIATGAMEKLELLLDECLNLARGNDNGELGKVIGHLRMARNIVIYKQGKFSD